jgi:hypothetical protein
MIDTRTKFVAVSTYTVAAQNLEAFQASTRETIERNARVLDGFCGGAVMTDEQQTQVLIVTEWDSKHAWIEAQWEPRIGKAVASFVTDATTYNLRTYLPVTIVHSP